MVRKLAPLLLLFSSTLAAADEAAIRSMVASKLREGTIVSIRKSAVAGLFEVVVRSADGTQILYVDERASVLIAGPMFDAKTDRNLTKERLRELSAIKWDSLPFEWALTTVRGNGRRKIAILSDPYCPYCKRFESDLATLDDITVHIFMYPVIRPESVDLTKSVWCSKDRAKAWNDLMLRGIRPSAAPTCATPVERIVELGRRLGVTATPAWFLENGEKYDGAVPLAEVRALLDAAARRTSAR